MKSKENVYTPAVKKENKYLCAIESEVLLRVKNQLEGMKESLNNSIKDIETHNTNFASGCVTGLKSALDRLEMRMEKLGL
jgi:hypothetical protein